MDKVMQKSEPDYRLKLGVITAITFIILNMLWLVIKITILIANYNLFIKIIGINNSTYKDLSLQQIKTSFIVTCIISALILNFLIYFCFKILKGKQRKFIWIGILILSWTILLILGIMLSFKFVNVIISVIIGVVGIVSAILIIMGKCNSENLVINEQIISSVIKK